jgi:hypothetical protein
MASNSPGIDREHLIGLLSQIHQLAAACLAAAGELPSAGGSAASPVISPADRKTVHLDFTLPLRAFKNRLCAQHGWTRKIHARAGPHDAG